MAKQAFSIKHLQINKANSVMLIAVGIAAFVSTFSLVASRALLTQRSFQSSVIKEKEKARDQLKANVEAANKLKTAYVAFVETPDNIIGGNPSGTGDKDGDNAKIVLDALPSKYDFPGLASSMDKLLSNRNVKVGTIGGSDEEVTQQEKKVEGAPAPIELPLSLTVSGGYQQVQNIFTVLSQSVRPMQIKTINLSGSSSELSASITFITFYQPEKPLTIGTKTLGTRQKASAKDTKDTNGATAAVEEAAK